MKRLMYTILPLLLAISLLGCQRTNISQVVENVSENQRIPFCKVGDILNPGQSCLDKGTDATFTVLDNGNAKYTSKSGLLFEATDVLDATGSTLNDQSYNFIARKRRDGSWIIERED